VHDLGDSDGRPRRFELIEDLGERADSWVRQQIELTGVVGFLRDLEVAGDSEDLAQELDGVLGLRQLRLPQRLEPFRKRPVSGSLVSRSDHKPGVLFELERALANLVPCGCLEEYLPRPYRRMDLFDYIPFHVAWGDLEHIWQTLERPLRWRLDDRSLIGRCKIDPSRERIGRFPQ
jgi:hypothetical protein